MKKIYILRHAKAGKANKKILDDHDRPLTKKGIEACALIKEFLEKNKIKPGLIHCSTAKRAKTTAELSLNFEEEVNIHYTSKLYLAGAGDILSIIKKTDDSFNSVMVVGHNPGLHELCLHLVKDGPREIIKGIKDFFPPGALAVFNADIKSWQDLTRRSALVTHFIAPKDLED